MGSVKIVSASAGSGKTYNLAYEYVKNVLSDPDSYKHILAVTFTNKATEEMKDRILTRIDDLAQGSDDSFARELRKELNLNAEEIRKKATEVRSKILHDYTRFSILTIDKFFQRIIRSFIRELGVDFNFTLELPVDTLLSKASDQLIDEISLDESLKKWITGFVNERIDENKKWDMRDEIISLGKEIFSETFRQGFSSARKKEELADIVKAAEKEADSAKKEIVASANAILNLLGDNSLTISDISGASRGVMSYIVKLAEGDIIPAINSKSAINTLESGQWYSASSKKKSEIDPLIPRLNELLANIFSADKTVNNALLLKENYRNFALLSDLEKKIIEVAREEGILHISEINTLLSKLISGNDTPFIFEKSGNYFTRFMIDEFQDTSGLQWENFLPLLKNSVAQSAKTPVMLVGDIKQSIYRWRGGDWTILGGRANSEFEQTESKTLSDNYRSRRKIVEFNNNLIGACVRLDNESVNSILNGALKRGEVSPKFREIYSDIIKTAYSDHIQTPADKDDKGYITVTQYDRDEDKKFTPPIIAMVEELQSRGYSAGDIAILVRTRSEGRLIANMLLERKSMNPDSNYSYDVITQEALVIGNSPICGFIISCLRLSVNIGDNISRAIYNSFIKNAFHAPITDSETGFISHIRLLAPEEAFEAIVSRYNLSDRENQTAYLQALHQQIISFSATNIADIPLFLDWWDEKGSTKSISMPSDSNAINIDTIHRSKGLGYKVVIIPFANWSMTTKANSIVWSDSDYLGAYPVKYKDAMSNSIFSEDYYREYIMSHIDNLNLLYVALTRSAEELHIMIPRTKTPANERVSYLINTSIQIDGSEAVMGAMRGRVEEEDNMSVIKFGIPSTQDRPKEQKQKKTIKFDTFPVKDRIKIKFDSQRYIEDGVEHIDLSPRDFGILMHRVFEDAADFTDIERKISSLQLDGVISDSESDKLKTNLSLAFEEEIVRGWFDGTWDEIRNENEIIVPGNDTYRPDRVMKKGDSIVVVDYKFTSEILPRHQTQVKKYVQLLKQMGYPKCDGYLWYIGLNKIINANN